MPSPLSSSSSSSSRFPSVMPLPLLLLISLLPTSFPSPAPPCSSSKCGDLVISYPFWLAEDPKDPPSSYCGYHGLMLFCDDRSAVLNLPGGGQYTVTHIDPSSKTFSLFDSAALADAKDSSCPRPCCNITSDENSFLNLTSEDTDLIFYYNCSKASLLPTCSSPTDGKYSYVVTSDQPLKPAGCEDMVVAPVLHSAVVGNGEFLSGNFTGVVQTGFQLQWSTAGGETCQRCESRGGNCGWDEGHGGNVCFCGGVISGQYCAGGNSTEKDGQHVGLVIGLGTGGGFSLAVVFAVGFVVYARKRRTRKRSVLLAGKESLPPTSKSDPELGSSFRAPIFSYDELHEATNGFHASNVLGDGGFGTVYKGKLRDGRVVAVKRLFENNSRRVEQFTNEVSILSLLRHPNLVNLYGCTPRRSPALLLVYEFVSNGTVAEHLHGSLSSSSPLVWETRMRIAVETAEALSYLHSVDPPIIHRDVKTSNILLDGSLHVKVADFGLSRLFPLDATHISTAPQGTPGYLDPEYHMCYQLTDKSDVYSFGVVLLELISSKPAVDITRRRNEINLAAMALGKMQRRELHEFVDARLGFMSDSSVEGMVSAVAEVAFRCLQAEREMRPPIKDVLEALRSIQGRRGNREVSEEAGELSSSPLLTPDSVTEGSGSMATTPHTSG